MSIRVATARYGVGIVVLSLAPLLGQQKPTEPSTPGKYEFPVMMRQKVEAGVTPVGTKVQAELVLATLVEGKVFPRGALFSGEVAESVAKTKSEPARLSIRMDSVRWKNESATVKVYLTAWYYPIQAVAADQDLRYGPVEGPIKTWDGRGAYPDERNPASRPFPKALGERTEGPPDTPATSISKRRELMKEVVSTHGQDGAVVISSRRQNIKLDKFTTYVLATGDLLTRD